jgi:hypothetical protein
MAGGAIHFTRSPGARSSIRTRYRGSIPISVPGMFYEEIAPMPSVMRADNRETDETSSGIYSPLLPD